MPIQNCETHFCPLAITITLLPICPVEWMLERDGQHAVKDVIFEDEKLEMIFTDWIKTNPFPILEKSMDRNNFVFEYSENSEDIYYDLLKCDGKSTPYLRIHLVFSRTPDTPPLRGLRVCVYGSDAIWIQAGVYKGSRFLQ